MQPEPNDNSRFVTLRKLAEKIPVYVLALSPVAPDSIKLRRHRNYVRIVLDSPDSNLDAIRLKDMPEELLLEIEKGKHRNPVLHYLTSSKLRRLCSQTHEAHQQQVLGNSAKRDDSSVNWLERLKRSALNKLYGAVLFEEILHARDAQNKTDVIESKTRDELARTVDPVVLMQYAENGHSVYVTTGESLRSFANDGLGDYKEYKSRENVAGNYNNNRVTVADIQKTMPHHSLKFTASSAMVHEFGHHLHKNSPMDEMIVAAEKDLPHVEAALQIIETELDCLKFFPDSKLISPTLALMGLPQEHMRWEDQVISLSRVLSHFPARLAVFMDLGDLDVTMTTYYAETRRRALKYYPTPEQQVREIPAIIEELCYIFPRPLVRHFLPHTFEACARSYDTLYAQHEKPEEALRKGGVALIRWDDHHCTRTDRSSPHCHRVWVDYEKLRRNEQAHGQVSHNISPA